MSGPTTAEVRERIGARVAMMRAADIKDGGGTAHQAYAWALTETALPIAEHRDAAVAERDALAAEVARLREALEKRYAAGHNDTCAAMLGDYACSCGHDGLLEATAKGAGR